MRDQLEVLHYEYGDANRAEEFAVDLCRYTEPYQVILARMSRRGTLHETAKVLQENVDGFKEDPDYETLHKLRPIDTLVVPDVLFKLTHHFEELLGKRFSNSRWQDHFFFEALQRIDFTLSRTGVVIKSEAFMGMTSGRGRSSAQLAKPRHLRFDRPFLICVKKRQAGATPIFVMWVDNAELMQVVARDP
ncbi:MAG TPA: hypothetical protein PKH24_07880 [Sedimentisphaerales bacterium]|nr:hypothetical protein [Sedimentisphaerales bacterium]HNU29317.1 hypothetical protein [Sedimentisphaerales bacterium]